MLNRKSTNTPLLRLIFAYLSLKKVFNEFLEAQLPSKVVFVLFLLNGSNLSVSCCQIKDKMISIAMFVSL